MQAGITSSLCSECLVQTLYETVRKRDPAQSEFLQAVEEVCCTLISKLMHKRQLYSHVLYDITFLSVCSSRCCLLAPVGAVIENPAAC